MTEQIELSIVRIRTPDGRAVGAGFLVAERQVLTCAHVVAAALSLPEDTPETPQAEVHLDFPLVALGHTLTARVIHWRPESDVAGLELDGDPPADARPVRLVTAKDLWRHAFRVFGFPTGYDDGVWASGVLRGRTAAGWVQIEDVKETGYFVAPGFSGAPVWDERLNGIVGMAVAAEARLEVKAAFMIPADVLAKAWPELEPILKRVTPPRKPSRREQRWRRFILKRMKKSWVKDMLESSLQGAALIELGMKERLEAIRHPGDKERPDWQDRMLPPGKKIVDVFDEMADTLLILGAPGSGKTTMLLELARNTIARAEQDPTQPIPVVFNLSLWTSQTIADWLVDELNIEHQIPKKIGRAWVKDDQLLLLLDGLDEVNPEHREACVEAINHFRQEHGLTGIVVCSRTDEYEALTTRLRLQGAIVLQPLTSQQIDDYLVGTGKELPEVRRTLQKDATFQELAQTPLFLSITALAYRETSVEDLRPLDSIEAHRKRLFDTYVEKMFKRRVADECYSKEQTVHWLTWLAQKMTQHSQTVFLIERMQPSWLQTSAQRQLYATGSGLIEWLIEVLIVGLVCGLFWGLPDLADSSFGFGERLILRLIFTPILGLMFWLVLRMGLGIRFGVTWDRVKSMLDAVKGSIREEIDTVEVLKWSWMAAIKVLILGLILGPIVGLLIWLGSLTGLLYDTPTELTEALNFGSLYGLMFGLMGGLIAGLSTQKEIEEAMVPNQGIRQSARNAIVVGLISGLISGLIFGLILGLIAGLSGGLSVGLSVGLSEALSVGLIAGLIAGLRFGGLACIGHLLLRFILHRGGHIPWSYVRFLDYATERIFLRKVGGRYIFIHGLLQEYFATLEPD